MDKPTEYLGRYIREKGINISKLAREIEVPYMPLYDSLANNKSDRDLRFGEAIKICIFLDIDPRIFLDLEKPKTA